MVGRELLTMCPLGEDHRGDDRGGGTTDNAISAGHGRMMIVSKSLILTMIFHKALSFNQTMATKDLFRTSFDLPASIWVPVQLAVGVQVTITMI